MYVHIQDNAHFPYPRPKGAMTPPIDINPPNCWSRVFMQSVHLFMLCPTVTHETSFDLSNLKAKILNCIGVFLKNPTLCSGVPNWRGAQFAGAQFAKAQFAKTRFAGAQFAAPGTQFDSAPKSVGLNLLPKQRGTRFAGAQFAGA